MWGLKVVLSRVSRVPEARGKKWLWILCRALRIPQSEWANCFGDSKFQNLNRNNGGELGIIHGQSGTWWEQGFDTIIRGAKTRRLMWTSAWADGRKTEGYANQNKQKCRLIHVTQCTHMIIFICEKIHLKTLAGERSAFQLSQSGKSWVRLTCHRTAENRVNVTTLEVKLRRRSSGVSRGEEPHSEHVRSTGAWESGGVWILMCQ